MENTFCIMNGLKVELRWLIAIYHLTSILYKIIIHGRLFVCGDLHLSCLRYRLECYLNRYFRCKSMGSNHCLTRLGGPFLAAFK